MMRNIRCRAAAFVCILILGACASAAHGQTASGATGRERPLGYVSLNAGAQFPQGDLDSHVTFPLYREEADFDASYTTPTGPLVDIGVAVRLWNQVAAGVALTWYQEKGTADVDASLPHVLHLRRSRELTASVPDLDRVETAVHLQAMWLAPAGNRVTVAVLGGPTVFRVQQDVVSGIVPRETYPYDEVQLENATIAERKDSTIGFHVGTDVQYRLTRQFGVGGVVRFSRGTLTVSSDADETLEIEAGGLQVSGGIRWAF